MENLIGKKVNIITQFGQHVRGEIREVFPKYKNIYGDKGFAYRTSTI